MDSTLLRVPGGLFWLQKARNRRGLPRPPTGIRAAQSTRVLRQRDLLGFQRIPEGVRGNSAGFRSWNAKKNHQGTRERVEHQVLRQKLRRFFLVSRHDFLVGFSSQEPLRVLQKTHTVSCFGRSPSCFREKTIDVWRQKATILS